ncbi:Peroxin-3, partial [Aureobasidium melanogenum]
MLEGTRRWFRRNRTRFAIGAGTLGLVYLAGQYAWSKWLEARQRMADERISRENLRRRFEQNQEDCTYTVLALLPTIREEIIGALPVEDITNELQRQRSEKLARSAGPSEAASSEFPSAPASTIDDSASTSSFQTGSYIHASQMADSQDARSLLKKKSKAQLWNDMKISSITRALTLLYTLSLLTLLTRIQLNLLGRRTYLSSVVSLANPPNPSDSTRISLENNDDDNYDNVYGNDFETNRKYLTFSWWLLHKGTKDIVDKVTAAVKDVFGPINPREDMTLERLSELILEVRKKVEGATEAERREHKWLAYMLPPRDQEDHVLSESGIDAMSTSPAPQETSQDPMHASSSTSSNASLRRLLDETSDLIDSPTFTHVFTQVLNATFSHLIDYRIATEAFKISPPAPDSLSRVTEISDSKCKFAQTLAVFCRQAHVIAAGSSEPDDLVAAESVGSQVNEYLGAIDQVKDLEAFAAVIYSSNFEFEAAERQADEANYVAPAGPVSAPATSAPTQAAEPPAETAAQASAGALSTEEMDHVWNRSQVEGPSAPNAPTYSEVVQAPAPESSSSHHPEAQESQIAEQETQTIEQETRPAEQQQSAEQPKTYAMAAAAATTVPPLTLIVATTAKNGIGKNGTLPWPMLKKEMAYFARVTKRVPGAASMPDTSLLAETSSQLSDSSEVAATANIQPPQNVVVMGRKTWESIPPKFRPLPQRTNVVISRSKKLDGVGEDVVVGDSISSALSTLVAKVKEGQAAPLGRVFVIGGAAIYKQALDMEQAKSILLTRVEGEWDCDTDFPIDVEAEQGWTRRQKGDLDEFAGEDVREAQEEEVKGDKVKYEFRLYERIGDRNAMFYVPDLQDIFGYSKGCGPAYDKYDWEYLVHGVVEGEHYRAVSFWKLGQYGLLDHLPSLKRTVNAWKESERLSLPGTVVHTYFNEPADLLKIAGVFGSGSVRVFVMVALFCCKKRNILDTGLSENFLSYFFDALIGRREVPENWGNSPYLCVDRFDANHYEDIQQIVKVMKSLYHYCWDYTRPRFGAYGIRGLVYAVPALATHHDLVSEMSSVYRSVLARQIKGEEIIFASRAGFRGIVSGNQFPLDGKVFADLVTFEKIIENSKPLWFAHLWERGQLTINGISYFGRLKTAIGPLPPKSIWEHSGNIGVLYV